MSNSVPGRKFRSGVSQIATSLVLTTPFCYAHRNLRTRAHFVTGVGSIKMWEDNRYFWVVLCKNRWFHIRRSFSLNFKRRIILAETDSFSPLPMLTERIKVRCPDCGEEDSYKPNEILRAEIEVPEDFVPHPLFQQSSTLPDHPAKASASSVAKQTH